MELAATEGALVAAAVAGDHDAFRRLVEPLGQELHLFCYRMLGSFHDAEDASQEALVKAWRGIDRYDRRASFRTWLFRIAANVARDALRSRRRRVLPHDLGAPGDPALGLGQKRHDIDWLEPYPDSLLGRIDPQAALELRESVALAFVRALQILPPKQRATLILRDVLDWSAAEVATALDTTVQATNSALQRARASIAKVGPSGAAPGRAMDAHRAAMASRYVMAWEAGDIEAIVSMLTEDVTHAMPPYPAWFVGRDALKALYSAYEIWRGRPGPGVFRVQPTALNGELAFAEYCRYERNGPYKAVALTVVSLDRVGTHISEKLSFV
ncbi:MAG TPA: RNA polymerase subunit sigma-70, partial [Gemmatimonadaceae bacterium]